MKTFILILLFSIGVSAGISITPSVGGGGDSWTDPLNSNIIPDGDLTRNLGATGAQIGEVWTDDIKSDGKIAITPSAGQDIELVIDDAFNGDNVVIKSSSSLSYEAMNLSYVTDVLSGGFPEGSLTLQNVNTGEVARKTSSFFLRSGDLRGTGEATESTVTGDVFIRVGDIRDAGVIVPVGAVTGFLGLRSGANRQAGITCDTGNVAINSGNNSGTGDTGDMTFSSGNATNGSSGGINIYSGSASGTSGSINLTVPTGTGGTGFFELAVGPSNLSYDSFGALSGASQLELLGNASLVINNQGQFFTNSGNMDFNASTGVIEFNANKLQNIADPTAAQDAATKNYVDLNAGGDLWSDPVDAVIIPDANSTRDIGTSSLTFNNIWAEQYIARPVAASDAFWIQGLNTSASQTHFFAIHNPTGVPSGFSASVGVGNGQLSQGLAFYTTNNNSPTANPSGAISIETGNVSQVGATGNSGDITLKTGNILGGVRGKIMANANLMEVLSGVATVKLTADPCADTVAFPESTLFYNDTSDYYCFCNGAGADVQMHSPVTACF